MGGTIRGKTPGAVSYAGGSTPLVGTGIPVGDVTGLGTPANNGISVPILGGTFGAGTLDFKTGMERRVTQHLNEWVMLSQSKVLAARGKVFEARDKILALLKADNSVSQH
jgi:hypothetical protein